ncbi:U3 small nucleolar RNA-associated protein [Boletus edulis BED1]|uniref:U3 small nucleolar RNA-associated protein n=1 Tax=Boletus edulis BED1 TaxID=1328754 RepID=A0AAD4GI35_BOLED|nr:U3 small nucleolar RNA-associated protein [Boletus edulis BED1]
MAGGQRPMVRTVYKQLRTIEPLHTSGPIAVTPDGSRIVTCLAEEALLTELSSGKLLCRFSCASESITTLCLSPSAAYLILFTTPPSLRLYDIPKVCSGQVVHPFRVIAHAHDAPVHVCTVDPTSSFLASGSADGIVKVWDISAGHVTHVFKGHGGVISALKFNFPRDPSIASSTRTFQLVTASVDTRIRLFDLMATSRNDQEALWPIAVLDGHVSVPRGLDVTPDGKWLISGGRDSVVLLWDMSPSSRSTDGSVSKKGKGKTTVVAPILTKTVPIMESVEAVGFVHPELNDFTAKSPKLQFFTAGDKGVVRIWDLTQGSVIYSLGTDADFNTVAQEAERQIIDALYLPAVDAIVSARADQNIFFHSLLSRSLIRHMVGYNDEIVDTIFLSPPSSDPNQSNHSRSRDTQLALATNSSLIRIYSISNLDAQVLAGHSDIVLSLDQGLGGRIFASGSKDKSARVWAFAQQPNSNGWGCIALCEGHTESVGSIAMSRVYDDSDSHPRFVFTGSQDRTIKMWDLSELPLTFPGVDPARCHSLATHKAHDKDINSLDIAPNDQFLASGSQDRTANIYEISYKPSSGGKPPRGEIKRLGCCKGHKRGVWNVRFGKTERVLATGSSDKTVKLWNLEDFTCVKTFEGHTNSVLRVDFINHGTHLVSSGSDGLVKLWNVKEETCVTTLDNHEDKVWALAISTDEATIVSGAADSVVTFWQDCTEEEEKEREAKRADQVLREQDFMNYLAMHDYRRAIELALAMQQPGKLLALFGEIRSAAMERGLQGDTNVSGKDALDEVLRTLSSPDLSVLVRYIRDWNTNAKTSGVAQSVLYTILRLRPAEEVLEAFDYSSPEGTRHPIGTTSSLKDIIDGLIPYTQRHLARLDRLVQESFVVDYMLNEMDDGMFDGTGGEIMDVDDPR